jgi:RNA polymerase sigma factor (sigma-70 family)
LLRRKDSALQADQPRIYIIDDDPAVLDSLALLLELHGFETERFESAEAFLAAYSPAWSGCVLVDLRMPGMSGLELQAEMGSRGFDMPLIMITAHGETSAARTSLKAGAVDFLEKPIDNQQLLSAIRAALEREAERIQKAAQEAEITRNLAKLTAREREVLDRVVAGRHNREIATELNISPRTVEVHKARIMSKLGVQRIPELVRVMLSVAR